jgi:hypothetical protein
MSVAPSVLRPPLRDGDRLTSDEFMRRWEGMPDLRIRRVDRRRCVHPFPR